MQLITEKKWLKLFVNCKKIFTDSTNDTNHLKRHVDLLIPPVSTVALEAAFSVANRQIDKRRNTLSPEILECQICVKDWDDTKYWIQHEITENSYVLESFNNIDLLDDEDTENNN